MNTRLRLLAVRDAHGLGRLAELEEFFTNRGDVGVVGLRLVHHHRAGPRERAAVPRRNELVGVDVELVAQRLGTLLLSVLALQRCDGVERGDSILRTAAAAGVFTVW